MLSEAKVFRIFKRQGEYYEKFKSNITRHISSITHVGY